MIAFIEDQTVMSLPHPVALPENNAWEWKTAAIVDNAVAAAIFFNSSERERELWKPTGMASSMTALPRLIYLPTFVVPFAIERPLTPWELFQFVGTLVQTALEDGLADVDVALL